MPKMLQEVSGTRCHHHLFPFSNTSHRLVQIQDMGKWRPVLSERSCKVTLQEAQRQGEGRERWREGKTERGRDRGRERQREGERDCF